MSRPEELWERLVRAALRRERTGDDAYGRPAAGIAGNVPSALAKNRDIDEILRVADEIQDEDPTVSRICMFTFILLYIPIHFISKNFHYCIIVFQVISSIPVLYYLLAFSCASVDYRKMLNGEDCTSPFDENLFNLTTEIL